MNRTIIAAVTGTLLAGFMVTVQADTTLYGNINISVDSFDIDDPAPGVTGDDVQMNSNTSAIGIKGGEALGNGLRAIYQAEFQIDADDGEEGDNSPNLSGDAIDRGDNSSTDAVLQGRDIWGGVEHDEWGQLRAGTISTTYKSYGAMIDPIYRTSLQGRDVGLQSVLHTGKGEEGQGRATNTLRYDSPSWAGFGLKGTFTLDNSDSDSETKNPYSVGAHWMNGPALVFVDWIDNNLGDKSGAWKVGGKYALGNLGLYGQYEGDRGLISQRNFNVTDPDVAKDWDTKGADVWFLGASYKAFNTLFFFGYGQGRDASDNPTGDSTKYKAWELAADYAFSKRTDIYGGYSNTKCSEDGGVRCSIHTDKGGELDLFTLGMRVKF